MSTLMDTLQLNLADIRYDSATDTAFGSIRLTSRLAGVDESSIREGAGTEGSKLHTYLTGRGFEGAGTDLKNGVPADMITSICTYYALHAGRWINDTAKLTLEWFAQVGLTLAIKSCFVAPEQPLEEVHEAVEPAKQVIVPDVLLIENRPISGNTYLDDIQRHLREVSKLRQQIKAEYDSAEDEDERNAMLMVLKLRTLEFCGQFAPVKSPMAFTSNEPDDIVELSPYQLAKQKRESEVVEFCKANPKATNIQVGKRFGIADRTVYVYLTNAGLVRGVNL